MSHHHQIKTNSKNIYRNVLEDQINVYFIDHYTIYRDLVFPIFSIG